MSTLVVEIRKEFAATGESKDGFRYIFTVPTEKMGLVCQSTHNVDMAKRALAEILEEDWAAWKTKVPTSETV